MAVKEIKDMGASVLTRLKKQAKETGINYQTCLQLFAQEEFLRKLEMSGYAENLVLKGGMFLYTISNYEGIIVEKVFTKIRIISILIAYCIPHFQKCHRKPKTFNCSPNQTSLAYLITTIFLEFYPVTHTELLPLLEIK